MSSPPRRLDGTSPKIARCPFVPDVALLSDLRRQPDQEKRGSNVNSLHAEWLMGLPAGWTDKDVRLEPPAPVANEAQRKRALSLFTGGGGLDKGVRGHFQVLAACEKNPDCRDVLHARARDHHLDDAVIFEDVSTLTKDILFKSPDVAAAVQEYGESEAIEAILMGFPVRLSSQPCEN